MRVSLENVTGHVTSISLAASYDDGKTWHPVRLTRVAGHWLASIGSPSGAHYVSLRTAAADSAGGSVAAVMIRAYALS